jgi:hypothetical protein
LGALGGGIGYATCSGFAGCAGNVIGLALTNYLGGLAAGCIGGGVAALLQTLCDAVCNWSLPSPCAIFETLLGILLGCAAGALLPEVDDIFGPIDPIDLKEQIIIGLLNTISAALGVSCSA